ncbi:MAG: DUF3530 family protein [Marinobacter sp.]|nr:DUF3530 family protein [Marinobacter sp.]
MIKRAHSVIEKIYSGMKAALLLACLGLAWPAHAQQDERAEGTRPDTGPAEPTGDAGAAEKRYIISSGPDEENLAGRWSDRTLWLELEGGPRALALLTREQDVPARGALLVLANEGDTPAAGMAGALHEPMARAGWAVMSLGLARLPVAVAYSRRQTAAGVAGQQAAVGDQGNATDAGSEEGAANAGGEQVMIDVIEEMSAESPAEDYRARVQASLDAAVQRLTDEGYERIVLAGVGRAAGHVTRYSVGSGRAAALVWIAPEFSGTAEPVSEWLGGKGDWPLLDLHNPGAGEQVRERQALIRRAGIAGYRPITVIAGDPPAAEHAGAVASILAAALARGQ